MKEIRILAVWRIKYFLCARVLLRHHHHHHHRWQPWAQCPLVSDGIVTIAAHRCLSRAAWVNSCRVAPHHCSMSSDHSWWGRPLLFEPSIIPNTVPYAVALWQKVPVLAPTSIIAYYSTLQRLEPNRHMIVPLSPSSIIWDHMMVRFKPLKCTF